MKTFQIPIPTFAFFITEFGSSFKGTERGGWHLTLEHRCRKRLSLRDSIRFELSSLHLDKVPRVKRVTLPTPAAVTSGRGAFIPSSLQWQVKQCRTLITQLSAWSSSTDQTAFMRCGFSPRNYTCCHLESCIKTNLATGAAFSAATDRSF